MAKAKKEQRERISRDECPHPPARYHAFHTLDILTGKNDWLTVGCCDCGKILTGSAELYEAYLAEHGVEFA